MNDPNGMVVVDGEYHLFFQHNPQGSSWGNMSWGHAVSRDLATWTELPVAIACTATEAVYSGSAVLDHRNTSGFGAPGQPVIVAVYTAHPTDTGNQTQCVAWSRDGGRTFTRLTDPVLDIGMKDFRDPKVLWHEDSGCWVMAVALSAEHRVRFYASDDLRTWRQLSDFGPAGAVGGVWECPDLFRLDVADEPGASAWVLLVSVCPGGVAGGSGTQYFVGEFDGTTFRATDHGWLDHGPDNYAGVTFNDEPRGRRILIAWMSNWDYAATTPTSPWRGAMTIPRELSLRRQDDRLVLAQLPVLVPTGPPVEIDAVEADDAAVPLPLSGTAYRAVVTLFPGDARTCGLLVAVDATHHTRIGYDVEAGQLYLDRRRSGATAFSERFGDLQWVTTPRGPDGTVRLEVVVDTCSVEVFAAGGAISLTALVFPPDGATGINVFAERGAARADVVLQPLAPNGVLAGVDAARVTPAGPPVSRCSAARPRRR